MMRNAKSLKWGEIVETKHITEHTTIKKENEWASVVVAAVFIL